jgi:aryl-alcohol dehydrogenase-like predicted oxidoreductase
MGLPRRRLGSVGPEITHVGFGAWAIGEGGYAFGWGNQDDTASISAIHHAIELGVTWVDAAAIYGLGRSEEVVGQALAGLPASQRPLVFTKCGMVWAPE